MTFDQVIAALQQCAPDAQPGATVQPGSPYYERAHFLTDYQMHEGNPRRYRGTLPHGGTMWVYVGNDGGIYCGPKDWD
jgi:hypothetical protein